MKLKALNEQVVVVTGASSGIGLVTARQAVNRGARVMMVARNEEALRKAVAELEPGSAAFTVADVSVMEQVEDCVRNCESTFGRIDSWINNAGLTIYGKIEDVPLDEQRRLFDINFWGIVYGSLAASRYFRQHGKGGAIINLGCVTSDRSFPLQVMYSASKHAVKAFTDGLRMELEHDDAHISVTLIKPSSINTPFTSHAKNYMEAEPTLPPPVYAPEVVADAILHAAENPVRDLVVGGAGRLLSGGNSIAPRTLDRIMEAFLFRAQKSPHPETAGEGSLYSAAGGDLNERGPYHGLTLETSAYTKASMHPILSTVMFAGGLIGARALFAKRRRPQGNRAAN